MTTALALLGVCFGLPPLAPILCCFWETHHDDYTDSLERAVNELAADLVKARRDLAVAVRHPSALGKLLPFRARNDDYWSAS